MSIQPEGFPCSTDEDFTSAFAQKVLDRLSETQASPEGKRASVAALELYIGGAIAMQLIGDEKRMQMLLQQAAMLVSIRGISAVKELASAYRS